MYGLGCGLAGGGVISEDKKGSNSGLLKLERVPSLDVSSGLALFCF